MKGIDLILFILLVNKNLDTIFLVMLGPHVKQPRRETHCRCYQDLVSRGTIYCLYFQQIQYFRNNSNCQILPLC